jgi:hypothetical protein
MAFSSRLLSLARSDGYLDSQTPAGGRRRAAASSSPSQIGSAVLAKRVTATLWRP